MDKKITTIDDIFNDDEFGLLDSPNRVSYIKSDEDRLIDSFEEINAFIDKNGREPSTSSMAEYSLHAKLKNLKDDEAKKIILKPYDKHNLLGYVDIPISTVDEILEDDEYGLLDSRIDDLEIFKLKNVPRTEVRAETDIVARRTPMQEKEFKEYENMFQQVHRDIKTGKRNLRTIRNVSKQVQIGKFYVIDGILLYLKEVDWVRENADKLSKETSRRKDGRTVTIFENGTYNNMTFRSLGKQIQEKGRAVSEIEENPQNNLFKAGETINEEDCQSGWIYVVRSKSANPNIAGIKDLYKIGFSTVPVRDRVANAKNEATYLFADVGIVGSYACYNVPTMMIEQLLQRFFAKVCLDVDVFADNGQRITPREWFIVPRDVIDEAIQLIINRSILYYMYDSKRKEIVLR